MTGIVKTDQIQGAQGTTVTVPTGNTLAVTSNATVGGTLGVTGVLTGTSLDISGDIDVDGTTNLDVVDVDGNIDVTGASNSVAALIKPQGALPDNNDNAGLYVLHQGTAGTGLRVRTDNALTGSNFAHILVNNASASINAFQVSQYGSGLIGKFDKSGTTVMQIDNTGAVTMPLQPAFSAYLSGNQDNIALNSNVTVQFDSEYYDQNADFNTSNYTFTAPITGKYQINTAIRFNNLDSAAGFYQVLIVTSNRTYSTFTIYPQGFSQDLTYYHGNTAILADMDANDTVSVAVYQNNGTQQTDISSGNDCNFSGYLVA